jgi:hypothetical protein
VDRQSVLAASHQVPSRFEIDDLIAHLEAIGGEAIPDVDPLDRAGHESPLPAASSSSKLDSACATAHPPRDGQPSETQPGRSPSAH